MAELVFEIGMEEMPARFFPALTDELKNNAVAALGKAWLDAERIETYGTPRRIVLHVTGMVHTQRQEEETVTGPPRRVAFDENGKPTKAAEGFARTQGVDLDQTFVLETNKGEYLAVKRTAGGRPALELLPDVLVGLASGLSFPKRMRWGAKQFGFGRPVRWLLALLDEEVVPLELAGIVSGRETRGHRDMGFGPFKAPSAGDYFEILSEKGGVVLDAGERLRIIRSSAESLAAGVGGGVAWNEDLLHEVCGLVEYPRVILGRYDESFLEVPREVLLTTMESHQKSFGVEREDGELLPYFLSTLNIEPRDPELVIRGWERVLRARLEDARFFWKGDLSVGFDRWLEDLDNVVFIGPLGTMGDKSRRLEDLCRRLSLSLAPDLAEDAARAGRLAKADLVSEMVGEFDELQGVMGGIYARRLGESRNVAEALSEQYLPAGPDSPTPATRTGALLSVSDKADTICGCFGLDMIPTGAHDPNALRRQALGICRIVIDHELRLNVEDLLAGAQAGYGDLDWKLDPDEARVRMLEFFAGRLKAHYTAKGFATLVVEAALAAGFADLWALDKRIAALQEFSNEPDFEQAVLTFKRAANIIVKQGHEAGRPLTGEYDRAHLEERQEKALADKLEDTANEWDERWKADDFAALLGVLRELRPFVDDFFDHVMVMCEDEDKRLNRLNLLAALVDRLGRLADFNALQI
jgi:glycyl-tRNA synthetase beta chain